MMQISVLKVNGQDHVTPDITEWIVTGERIGLHVYPSVDTAVARTSPVVRCWSGDDEVGIHWRIS